MGKVGLTVETIGATYPNGAPAPIYDPAPVAGQALTSSGTAAQSSITVPDAGAGAGGGSLVWRVATDTAIWVAFGANPTAAVGTGRLVPPGVETFRAIPGQRASVIDA